MKYVTLVAAVLGAAVLLSIAVRGGPAAQGGAG